MPFLALLSLWLPLPFLPFLIMEGDFNLSHKDFNTDLIQTIVLLPFGLHNNNFQTITLELKLENQYINSLTESNVYST